MPPPSDPGPPGPEPPAASDSDIRRRLLQRVGAGRRAPADLVKELAHDLGYTVREQMIAREMLYIADEMFFTGTAAEISPVRSVDRIPVGAGKRGPVTQRIQEDFFAITSGQVPDRFGWMTRVPAVSTPVRPLEGR